MGRKYIKTGKPPGQPTKFTPGRTAVILEALGRHHYLSTACERAGIDERTFYNWMDKAEAYDNKLLKGEDIGEEGLRYIQFFASVKSARSGSEIALLGRIDTAGSEKTLIEQRTINHTLKDGTTKTETIERWKPPDWTANAWILERTKWEKYGQHSSLDIQQAGVVFIERLQKARTAQIVEGECRELGQIANEPVVEEIAPTALIAMPSTASQPAPQPGAAPRRRPILELIATKRASIASTSYINHSKNHQPEIVRLTNEQTTAEPGSGQAQPDQQATNLDGGGQESEAEKSVSGEG
jgi:hypothetical protein